MAGAHSIAQSVRRVRFFARVLAQFTCGSVTDYLGHATKYISRDCAPRLLVDTCVVIFASLPNLEAGSFGGGSRTAPPLPGPGMEMSREQRRALAAALAFFNR